MIKMSINKLGLDRQEGMGVMVKDEVVRAVRPYVFRSWTISMTKAL